MASKLMPPKPKCTTACTRVIKFMTDKTIPASTGMKEGSFRDVDGYRFINIFVQFIQENVDEAPVDLGVIFSLDREGEMGARRYVNLEDNLPEKQRTNSITVSGTATWGGSPHNVSRYVVRLPVMGPYVQAWAYNREAFERKVSVWGYAVS